MQRLKHIYELEFRRQASIHEADLCHRDEGQRRLKLRTLYLRDDNAALNDKLLHKNSRIRLILSQADQVRTRLDAVNNRNRVQEVKLKKQGLEVVNLKVRCISDN